MPRDEQAVQARQTCRQTVRFSDECAVEAARDFTTSRG
jgi:hypothetical protein